MMKKIKEIVEGWIICVVSMIFCMGISLVVLAIESEALTTMKETFQMIHLALNC